MNIRYFSWLRGAAALGLGLALLGGPSAAMTVQDPRAFIGRLGTQATVVLAPTVPAEQRVARFRRLIEEDFDTAGIGRFALGRYWQTATPRQREVFLALLQEYTARAYSAWLGAYGGAAFRVTGSRRDGEQTIVTSDISRPGSQPIRINWHLGGGGAYKITDVDIDGLSMKVAERERFAAWIEKNGGQIDALLAVLRQQIVQLQ